MGTSRYKHIAMFQKVPSSAALFDALCAPHELRRSFMPLLTPAHVVVAQALADAAKAYQQGDVVCFNIGWLAQPLKATTTWRGGRNANLLLRLPPAQERAALAEALVNTCNLQADI